MIEYGGRRGVEWSGMEGGSMNEKNQVDGKEKDNRERREM